MKQKFDLSHYKEVPSLLNVRILNQQMYLKITCIFLEQSKLLRVTES
jgi:hypothetical protein